MARPEHDMALKLAITSVAIVALAVAELWVFWVLADSKYRCVCQVGLARFDGEW